LPFTNITLQKEAPVAIITINRPDKLNALNLATFAELKSAFQDVAKDDDFRGILITGSGEKAFVAGADISEIEPLGKEDGSVFSKTGQEVFNLIETSTKPVIALIDGFALGGGCELAMACHLRICTDKSKFGQPEVNLGLIPGYGATQRLPRLIGRGPALQLLLTGEIITAERAYQLGLINMLVKQEDLLEKGRSLLDSIITKSPVAVKNILHVVNNGLDMKLPEGLNLEADYFGRQCATEDKAEGTRAFLEKRTANFKGK
jgi:enoyl-CoA hydratase